MHLSATDMAPEGIAFDLGHKDRLLLGSTSTGAIRGVPRPPTGTSLVSLTLSEVYTYFLGGGSVPISSVKGLLVNPLESCQLWMAVDSHPIGNLISPAIHCPYTAQRALASSKMLSNLIVYYAYD